MTPTISLVMAAWNRQRYISDAIKSVLAQTRRDFELIVWDDGSTDRTVEVARRAINDDPRVRIIQSEHRNYISAINQAADLVSGAYFGTMDSDDMLAETALAETSRMLDENPSVGMVYTDYMVIDSANTVLGPGVRTKIPYSRDRLLIDFMTFHFRLMRKSIFDAAGRLNPDAGLADDYDLCLRLSEMTEIRHVAQPLYYYRLHADSASRKGKRKQIEDASAAIRRALMRRGLAEKYELVVDSDAKFALRKRSR